jgi:hypothetical protein
MATATATGTGTVTATVEDLLRLAWLADADGRPRLRDAMLTLAVAESGPEDAVLADRCRRLLVARQPGHWYASSATLGQALAHRKVAAALAKLRAMFPPVRVQRMLLRGDVERGPYRGRTTPLLRILEDLGLAPERPIGADVGAPRGRSRSRPQAIPFLFIGPDPALEPPDLDDDGNVVGDSLVPFYLAVLFSMAVLLNTVVEQDSAARGSGTRAA